MKLSARMQALYESAIWPGDFWDLCCDHGYMGLYAYESEKFKTVHFVDRVQSIIMTLEENFESQYRNDLNKTLVKFYSESAQNLTNHFSGNVIIAGVGGDLIIKVLNSSLEAGTFEHCVWVMSPQKDEKLLVQFLMELKRKYPKINTEPSFQIWEGSEKSKKLRSIYRIFPV